MTGANVDQERPLVVIVDDDEAVRASLEELMLSVGIEATGFGSTRRRTFRTAPRKST